MYGLIAKLTIADGKRDEMIAVLREGAGAMPGCLSYVVQKDPGDANTLWVTEVWESQASHDASFADPAVKNAVTKGRPLATAFEKVAETEPVSGAGLPG